MKKELIRTLGYGLQYVVTSIVLLLITGCIETDGEFVEYLAMVGIFLIPIAVMVAMNLIRVYRESKLIEKIEERRNEAA